MIKQSILEEEPIDVPEKITHKTGSLYLSRPERLEQYSLYTTTQTHSLKLEGYSQKYKGCYQKEGWQIQQIFPVCQGNYIIEEQAQLKRGRIRTQSRLKLIKPDGSLINKIQGTYGSNSFRVSESMVIMPRGENIIFWDLKKDQFLTLEHPMSLKSKLSIFIYPQTKLVCFFEEQCQKQVKRAIITYYKYPTCEQKQPMRIQHKIELPSTCVSVQPYQTNFQSGLAAYLGQNADKSYGEQKPINQNFIICNINECHIYQMALFPIQTCYPYQILTITQINDGIFYIEFNILQGQLWEFFDEVKKGLSCRLLSYVGRRDYILKKFQVVWNLKENVFLTEFPLNTEDGKRLQFINFPPQQRHRLFSNGWLACTNRNINSIDMALVDPQKIQILGQYKRKDVYGYCNLLDDPKIFINFEYNQLEKQTIELKIFTTKFNDLKFPPKMVLAAMLCESIESIDDDLLRETLKILDSSGLLNE